MEGNDRGVERLGPSFPELGSCRDDTPGQDRSSSISTSALLAFYYVIIAPNV